MNELFRRVPIDDSFESLVALDDKPVVGLFRSSSRLVLVLPFGRLSLLFRHDSYPSFLFFSKLTQVTLNPSQFLNAAHQDFLAAAALTAVTAPARASG